MAPFTSCSNILCFAVGMVDAGGGVGGLDSSATAADNSQPICWYMCSGDSRSAAVAVAVGVVVAAGGRTAAETFLLRAEEDPLRDDRSDEAVGVPSLRRRRRYLLYDSCLVAPVPMAEAAPATPPPL